MDPKTLQRAVGANLRRARWAAGMTQEDVAAAEVAGRRLSLRYYQEIERGQRNPTLAILAYLATLFGSTVAALVDVDPRATERARARLAKAPDQPPRRGRRPKKARGK